MIRTTADVLTDAPARYAKQLAAHLGRRLIAEETPVGPRVTMEEVELGRASCLMDTSATDVLHLEVEGDGQAAVDRLAQVVGSHLERFGERAGLVVEWRAG